MEISNAQRVRLAVALTALRHKPMEQTHEAYVLDLQTSFPVQSADLNLFDVAGQWRARVMQLEAKVHKLEEEHREDSIEIAALRATPSVTQSADTQAGPSASEPQSGTVNKKKPKKRAKADSTESAPERNEAILFKDLCAAPLSGFGESLNLFSALHTLDALVMAHTNGLSGPNTEPLFSSASRAIDKLAEALSRILSTIKPNKTSLDAISALSTMLTRLLTLVIPLFGNVPKDRKKRAKTAPSAPAARDSVETLLGQILTSILLPALRSFSSLSQRYISSMLAPNSNLKSKSKRSSSQTFRALLTSDLRPAVFDLLRSALSTLGTLISASPPSTAACTALQSHLSAVQRSLALEAVRELHRLYPPITDMDKDTKAPNDVGPQQRQSSASSPPSSSADEAALRLHLQAQSHPQTQSQRPPPPVQRRSADRERERRWEQLARKDALWYVCSVAHLTLPGTTPSTSSPTSSAFSIASAASDRTHAGTNRLLLEGVWEELGALMRRMRYAPGGRVTTGECASVGADAGGRDERDRDCEHAHAQEDKGEQEGVSAREPGRSSSSNDGGKESDWRGSAKSDQGVFCAVEREMVMALVERVWLAQEA